MRHKGYTAINILGLATGITCCILIMLFVRSEWSFDRFHSKSDRLYRAWVKENYDEMDDITDINTPFILGPALSDAFPEIETTCRVGTFNTLVKYDQNSFSERVHIVDSTFFNVFDFKVESGDRKTAFASANSIVITERAAKKYFGNKQAIGQILELQFGEDKKSFTVAAVTKNPPEPSSIQYDLIITYANWRLLYSERGMKNWYNVNPETYVLLKKGVIAKELEKKFPSMIKQYHGEDYKEGHYIVSLQPMTSIHLDTSLPAGTEPTSDPKYSYILLTIGVLILVVACINFITLSIGRSTTRALEVGVRKALGAERIQLIRQFWSEAILVTLVSFILGLLMTYLLVKPFNQLINRQLVLQFDLLFFGFCLLTIAIIGLIAGIYPALVLSGFRPVEVLKGKLKSSSNIGWLRKGLITGQFITSIGMIVCTIVIGEQLKYMQTKDLGYSKEQVVIVSTSKNRLIGTELGKRYKTELAKHPQVISSTVSIMSFAESPWINVGYTDDKKIYRDFQVNAVDADFLKTMGIKVKQGRDFQNDNGADLLSSLIVNEALVKKFEITNPVGNKLPGNMDQQIVGVVGDFNFESLHTNVKPLAILIKPDSFFRKIENISYGAPLQPRISVRLKPGNLEQNLAILRQAWKAVAPDQEFEYRFLDESIAALYKQEQRTNAIIQIASALAIFIACMGLFGLATLSVARRTKEIGIRKVLGASVGSVVALLSTEFLKMVLIAALIAFPLAWWAMNSWLEDFAYRVNISWWVYVAAGLLTVIITLVTISFQTIRAALMNPVKSLRTE
jgi:putative ABC transport system permease protein